MQTIRLLNLSFILLVLSVGIALGQETKRKPFANLDDQVKRELGGWNGSKQPLAKTFNAERQRLGVKFESELLKYLGTDVEKHYWISSFLESQSYLQGNPPLPYLSLLIKQQGLALCTGKGDQQSKHFTVGLGVTAAVLSEQLGLGELAKYYKATAERLITEDADLKGSFPAMDENEHKIYDRIKASSLLQK